MKKIFIIGSLKHADVIEKYAESLKKKYEVDYVKKERNKILSSLIRQAFDKIEKADIIVAVCKEDGTFGDGTCYEMEYARRVRKTIMMVGYEFAARKGGIKLS